jgi:hypothetical protein
MHGFIYMYAVDFGPYGKYLSDRRSAIGKVKEEIMKTVGLFVFYDTYVFAMQNVAYVSFDFYV